ncbi:DNA alkylation repair protein [Streptomonospora litoralis]|uniref:DNA alkylation repair enzyme n=1 Tax=Streptomonospora litoralis TaxID=2498135 RepID=A0A4V0ZK34_9ACTN|nr:DNA alkylation repair protein [Streptomonospora litoralis]QBI55592.1 DNA alkylation repair enzyme [Streptomonospora litoralis]
MSAHFGVVAAVRERLRELADSDSAEPMRAYMKSDLPFHGVRAETRRRAMREVFAAHPIEDRTTWEDTVRALWEVASHREERYAAVQLTGDRLYRRFQMPDSLGLYGDLVSAGAWWDYVDEIAARRVGPLLLDWRDSVRPVVRSWSTCGDMWLRRTAIICQIHAKERTDTRLLAEVVQPNLTHPGFFIRKAVGWALRSHAATDPDWVHAFVTEHEETLAPLARREALKHIGPPPQTAGSVAPTDAAAAGDADGSVSGASEGDYGAAPPTATRHLRPGR